MFLARFLRKILVVLFLAGVALAIGGLVLPEPVQAKTVKTKTSKAKTKKKHTGKRHARSVPVDRSTALYADIVIDAKTGRVLHATNANGLRHPASLTKMMTLYLTFQALEAGKIDLDDTLAVSEEAASQSPTKLGLHTGQRVRVKDAILGLVTVSANDAAVVLAEGLGGDVDRFARLMTAQAKALGMSNTVFRNPNGLPDPEQVTTAHDMAVLGQALLYHYPRYYPFFSQESYVYAGVTRHNHNHLMERYDGMDGIKTGYVRTSGFNLVASVERNGRRLIGVVFGGKSAPSRDQQMAALLDDAFAGDNAATVGQGDAEDETVSSPPKASVAFRAPGSVAEVATGNWAIQIGAFTEQNIGQAALQKAQKKTGPLLRAAKTSLDPITTSAGKTLYRARFSGLNEKMARSVCAYLIRHGQSCMVVAPDSNG
jgi:D-alanyl-D-alanine carboxypeptidase